MKVHVENNISHTMDYRTLIEKIEIIYYAPVEFQITKAVNTKLQCNWNIYSFDTSDVILTYCWKLLEACLPDSIIFNITKRMVFKLALNKDLNADEIIENNEDAH